MDRFCRILAAAGHHVVAPFVPGYLALTPDARCDRRLHRACSTRSTLDAEAGRVLDLVRIAARVRARRRARPTRSIASSSSAATPTSTQTMRFCLTGEVARAAAIRDPLNQPVVLMNLLEHLDPSARDATAASHGWRAYVERTWGRPELKARERFIAIAEELAPTCPSRVRELFLIGVGARPGAWDLAMPALDEVRRTRRSIRRRTSPRVTRPRRSRPRRRRRRHPVRAVARARDAACRTPTSACTSPACTATPARSGRRSGGSRASWRRCCACCGCSASSKRKNYRASASSTRKHYRGGRGARGACSRCVPIEILFSAISAPPRAPR